MSTVIKVENLSKKYVISHEGRERYVALRDVLTDSAKKIGSRLLHPVSSSRGQHRTREEFWALKDVSFEVKQGERLGIIGRNGAGKSTLLKLLSRITEPTEGRISIKGRVSSLLEVGTGFHPELTGRENIFLNGAILGMSKAEINHKFDEIVAFAEVEKFLDTPVKRYSSGMQVRLAFAIAAHLEPEILLVDEVLAVGDYEFQKKCLGKMEQVAGEGRTVLFVSHNMTAVEKLCKRALLIQDGKIICDGNRVRFVIDKYMRYVASELRSKWCNSGRYCVNNWFYPVSLTLTDENGDIIKGPVRNNKRLFINLTGNVKESNKNLYIGYYLVSDKTEYPIYLSNHNDTHPSKWPTLKENETIKLTTKIPISLLNEGKYYIKVSISLRFGSKELLVKPIDNEMYVSFEISDVANDSPSWIKRKGVIAPIIPWVSEKGE